MRRVWGIFLLRKLKNMRGGKAKNIINTGRLILDYWTYGNNR